MLKFHVALALVLALAEAAVSCVDGHLGLYG